MKVKERQWKVNKRQWTVNERQWKVNERQWKDKERQWKDKERQWEVKERYCRTFHTGVGLAVDPDLKKKPVAAPQAKAPVFSNMAAEAR